MHASKPRPQGTANKRGRYDCLDWKTCGGICANSLRSVFLFRPQPAPSVHYCVGKDGKELSALANISVDSMQHEQHEQLPMFTRLTPEDDRGAVVEGYFTRRLQTFGLLDEDGNVMDAGGHWIPSLNAPYIQLTINKMLSTARRYKTILYLTRDLGQYMGPVNIATAMHRLGRLVRKAKARNPSIPERVAIQSHYHYLLFLAQKAVDSMAARGIANFIWGMAALGDTHHVGIILRLGQRLMDMDPAELKEQELSNVLWGLATLDIYIPELMDRMLDSACSRINECVPQALSNMVWACATLRHVHSRFFHLVAETATPNLQNFQSQTLANTLWAFSVLGEYPIDLFQQAGEEIVRRLTMEIPETEDEGQEQEPPASKAIDADTTESYLQFRGQEISNILIAFARGGVIHPKLLNALESELSSDGASQRIEPLELFTSQALTNTLWAFATLRWYPARLLPPITKAIGNIVAGMTAQELSNVLWAYARFAYHPGRVMATFLSVIESRLSEFEGQGCTNSLWALGVLKATHSGAFVGLLNRYINLEKSNASFGELQYNQVLQAVLLAQFEERGGRVKWRPEIDLPEEVVDRALAAWASQQMSTQLSGFHIDVSEGLMRLGVTHSIEQLVARDLLSIDIAVVQDGRNIAIEVDGPFHFPVNARTPLGHTMIRRRLLRAAGWTVVSIPWYEWFQLQTWDDRLAYLANLLASADSTFAERLKPAMNEILSTEFAPGINASMDDSEGQLDTSVMVNTMNDDGPVLSYYSNSSNFSDIHNELILALTRKNVQLTSGAIRRLQSMGLDNLVQEVAKRNQISGKGVERMHGSSHEVYSPLPAFSSADTSEGLLPKPRLPRRQRVPGNGMRLKRDGGFMQL